MFFLLKLKKNFFVLHPSPTYQKKKKKKQISLLCIMNIMIYAEHIKFHKMEATIQEWQCNQNTTIRLLTYLKLKKKKLNLTVEFLT